MQRDTASKFKLFQLPQIDMNQFAVWVFFAALSVVTKSSLGIADINRPVKYCIMERAHRMIGYNCAKLELRDIPTYLKTSTEVSNARGFWQPERSWNAFRTMQKLFHRVPTPAKPAVPFKLKLINLNWLEHQRLALGHFFDALTHEWVCGFSLKIFSPKWVSLKWFSFNGIRWFQVLRKLFQRKNLNEKL